MLKITFLVPRNCPRGQSERPESKKPAKTMVFIVQINFQSLKQGFACQNLHSAAAMLTAGALLGAPPRLGRGLGFALAREFPEHGRLCDTLIARPSIQHTHTKSMQPAVAVSNRGLVDREPVGGKRLDQRRRTLDGTWWVGPT